MWKDLWDVALGVAYIPIDKLDPQTDLVRLIFMNHNELHEIFKKLMQFYTIFFFFFGLKLQH